VVEKEDGRGNVNDEYKKSGDEGKKKQRKALVRKKLNL
jgi:hypothetical protein